MNAAVYQYNPNDGYVAVVTAYAETLARRARDAVPRTIMRSRCSSGSAAGTVRLPVGYAQSAPIDAAAYLATNPADAA